jgi:hypothetical protein
VILLPTRFLFFDYFFRCLRSSMAFYGIRTDSVFFVCLVRSANEVNLLFWRAHEMPTQPYGFLRLMFLKRFLSAQQDVLKKK